MRASNPRLPSGTVPLSREKSVSKVWMFSHECAGLAQAGGLGEAVAGLSKTLATDSKLDVSVFLPSHGRHLDPRIRELYGLQDLSTFIAQGHRTGVNGLWYNYLAGMEKGSRNGVNYFLAKGLDSATIKWLDDPIIYDHDTTFEKMSLFARTLGTYTEYLISMGRIKELPDLIHAHDWHMVPAGVLVKQRIQERGVVVPLVFTVHLLSGVALPWHYASEDWCGIRDVSYPLRTGGKRVSTLKYSQLWRNACHNSLERFGCYAADYVTSVSHSYLTSAVRSYVGGVIRGKSGHIYNGCDWRYDDIKSTVFTEQKELTASSEPAKLVNRWDLRNFLLTRGIAGVFAGTVAENLEGSAPTSNSERMVEPFPTDGPLVLMTGRVSPQKGADLLLDAVPLVTKVVPTAKFLLFLLPLGDTIQMNAIEEDASAYPENVRIIFAKNRPLYMMSHIAADVYAMPSRSEPFGISALEAMATGNPVVGSNIGGIRETVLDIPSHGITGTGVLVPPDDRRALANSLISMLLLMVIDEQTNRGESDPLGLLQSIPVKPLANFVSKNPTLGSKIRENCRARVEHSFRWKDAGQMALERYARAQSMAHGAGGARKPSI